MSYDIGVIIAIAAIPLVIAVMYYGMRSIAANLGQWGIVAAIAGLFLCAPVALFIIGLYASGTFNRRSR